MSLPPFTQCMLGYLSPAQAEQVRGDGCGVPVRHHLQAQRRLLLLQASALQKKKLHLVVQLLFLSLQAGRQLLQRTGHNLN